MGALRRFASVWLCTSVVLVVACGDSGSQSSSSTTNPSGGGDGGDGGSQPQGGGGSAGSPQGGGGEGGNGNGGNGGTTGVGAGPVEGNHAPKIVSNAPTAAKKGETYYYPVLAEDLDGDPLTFSLPSAPDAMTIDPSTGLVAWTPTKNDGGTFDVLVRVTDPSGGQDEQGFTLSVGAGSSPPKITSLPPLTATAGGTYTYDAVAVDPDDTNLVWSVTGPAGIAVDPNGKVTWSVPGGATGNHAVTLQVEDPQGQLDQQAFSIGVPAGNGPPTVAITGPAAGAVLSEPTVVTGTANDLDLAGYTVEVCPLGWGGGTSACRKIKDGLTPVVNGPLATLDPRTFADGGYTIRLTAKDAGGLTSTATRDVRVTGDKLGALRLEMVDLALTTGDTELTLSRVYDGLDLRLGELGHGWRYRWSMLGHVEQPADPHTGWSLQYINFPPAYQLNATNAHPIAFELADGRYYRFELVVEVDGAISSIHSARPTFVELTSTGANVDALRANGTAYSETSYDLWFNASFVSEDILAETEWKPAFYRLTTEQGEVIVCKAGTGEVVRYSEPGGIEFDGPNNIVKLKGQTVFQITKGPDGLVQKASDLLNGTEVTYARDAAGDITSVVAADGAMEKYVYASGHRLKSFESTGAAPTVYEYDDQGRITKRTGPDGAVTKTTYDDAGKKIVQTDAAGNTVITAYDAKGRVLQMTDPLGHTRSFTYLGDTPNLLSQTDPLGRKTEFAYDAKGRKTLIKNPAGEEIKLTYDNAGQVTQIVDAEGHVFTETFDAFGRPTAAFLPGSAQPARTIAYPAGNTAVITDANGFTTTLSVDPKGRLTTETDWAGRTSTTSFNDATGTALITEPDGETHEVHYDKLGRMTGLDRPGMGSIEYNYTSRGLPSEIVRPDQGTIQITKDKARRLESVVVDGETAVLVQKDALGRVASTKTADGAQIMKYDAAGRVTQVISPAGAKSYSYDPAGQLVAVSTDDGRSVTFGRDLAGRITGISDTSGVAFGLTYDKNGRVMSLSDAEGRTTVLGRDPLGRVTSTTLPNGLSVGRTYFPAVSGDEEDAQLASFTGIDGVTWSYEYDGDGHLLESSAGPGFVTTFEYDPAGNLSLVEDALGRLTQRTWGPSDVLQSLQSPAGKTQSWTYTADQDIASWTRADGSTVTYERTPTSLKTMLPGGAVYEIVRGPAGEITSQGAPGGAVQTWGEASGQTRFVTTEDGATLQVTYTADGKVESVTATTPQGQSFVTSYGYDAGGRLTQVQDPDGAVTQLAYDNTGRLSTVVRPNGTVTEHEYGLGDRPTKIRHKTGAQITEEITYGYDQYGRITSATTSAGQTTFEYDSLGRLTKEQKSGSPASTWAYDAVGNATSKTSAAGTTTQIYSADDELTSAQGPGGTTTYAYSPRGALTQISGPSGATTLAYDALDRLTSVTTPDGVTVSYKYDATGRLLSRTDGSGERRCLPMPKTDLRMEDCALTYAPGASEAPRAFVFGPAGVLSRHGDSGARYLWSDVKGSVIASTSTAGAVVGQYSYDAWGARTVTSGETFEYGYNGERQDAATGFVFLRARHYAPGISRFLTPDKYGAKSADPRTLHRYAFTLNDPLNRMDPSGEITLSSQMVTMSLQGMLRSIQVIVNMCIKNQVQGELISAVVEHMLAAPIRELITPALAHLAKELSDVESLEKILEGDLHKALKNFVCNADVGSLLTTLIGGDGKWTFFRQVSTCGKDVGDPKDCDGFLGAASNAPGIDIVYGNNLAFELKKDTKSWHGSGSHGTDDEELARFCRWSAEKKMHLTTYVWWKFPGYRANAKRAWKCWTCWSREPSAAGCVNRPSLGSIYIAFGVLENKCKKHTFVPKLSSCTEMVKNLTCAEQ